MNQDLVAKTQDAMGAFIDRLARAQRLSSVRAPQLSSRDTYSNQARLARLTGRAAHQEDAVRALRDFIHGAEQYRQATFANAPKRTWNQYEDQRLRKPIAKLKRLLSEHERWEAVRRLQGPIGLVRLSNGQAVRVTDWREESLFDTA